MSFEHSDSPEDQRLPLTVAGKTIKPKDRAKHLGVYIEKRLTFKKHVEYAVPGKGVKAAAVLTRLANMTTGMPHKFIRQLFIGLVVPRMEYALPVRHNPVREGEGRRQGAVGVAREMSKPQRLACKVMAGGLRSKSTDALDYHANVLPTHLCMNLAAYKFAARLCTLPCSQSPPENGYTMQAGPAIPQITNPPPNVRANVRGPT